MHLLSRQSAIHTASVYRNWQCSLGAAFRPCRHYRRLRLKLMSASYLRMHDTPPFSLLCFIRMMQLYTSSICMNSSAVSAYTSRRKRVEAFYDRLSIFRTTPRYRRAQSVSAKMPLYYRRMCCWAAWFAGIHKNGRNVDRRRGYRL